MKHTSFRFLNLCLVFSSSLFYLVGCIQESVLDQLPPLEPPPLQQPDSSPPLNPQQPDCQGVYGGLAREDQCGVCDADPNNDCIQDCRGIWGGQTPWSECDQDAFIEEEDLGEREINDDMMLRQDLDMSRSLNQDLSPPVEMDLNPPVEMDLNPPVEMDFNPPVEMDLNPPVEMDMMSVMDMETPREPDLEFNLDQGMRDCFGVVNGSGELDLCGVCVASIEERCERNWRAQDDEGHLSGEGQAPQSCANREQDQNEQGIDCGGACQPCNQLSPALLATQIAVYYDQFLFPNLFVMRTIEYLKIQGNQAYVYYGYARHSDPENVVGYDSRQVSFTHQANLNRINITFFGANESGLTQAPHHCIDQQRNGDETETDCGGSCSPCRQLNEAALAMSVKSYYDLNGVWAGQYLIHSIPLLVWEEGIVNALYGYADVDDPNTVLGYDSRRFTPSLSIRP